MLTINTLIPPILLENSYLSFWNRHWYESLAREMDGSAVPICVLTITRTLSDLPSAAKQPTVPRRKDTVSCPEQHKPRDNSDTTESGKPLTSTPRSRHGSTEQLTCETTQIRIASEQDSARCFSEKAGRLVLTGKHRSMEYSSEGQSNLTL